MKTGPVCLTCMVIMLTVLSACAQIGQPETYDFKPAIMVDGEIYWISTKGEVSTIPAGCTVVGQIETVSAPTRPPEVEWEAIGFSEDFVGADIYRTTDLAEIYVYNPDQECWVQLQLQEE